MDEQVILFEVRDQGQIINLVDGRKLQVNPGDTPTTATWYPTMSLVISADDSNSMFPVKIRNTATDQEISSTWIT